MKQIYKDIQKRFEGFIKTPFLWNTISIFGLYQFEINQKLITYDKKIDIDNRNPYEVRFFVFELNISSL